MAGREDFGKGQESPSVGGSILRTDRKKKKKKSEKLANLQSYNFIAV